MFFYTEKLCYLPFYWVKNPVFLKISIVDLYQNEYSLKKVQTSKFDTGVKTNINNI